MKNTTTVTQSDVDAVYHSFKCALAVGHVSLAEFFFTRLAQWTESEDLNTSLICLDAVERAEELFTETTGRRLCPDCELAFAPGVDEVRCLPCYDKFLQEATNPAGRYYEQLRGTKLPGAGDVSRDDTNRHLREQRLGYGPPSADWSECHRVIRCIWPKQKITRPIDKAKEFFLFSPAITPLDLYYGTPLPEYGQCRHCKFSDVALHRNPCYDCTFDKDYWEPVTR